MLIMSKMKQVSLGHVYLIVKVLASLLIQANGGWIKTMLTYNTALWERLGLDTAGPNITVPSRVERRDAIIQQLKRACADVICLQEELDEIHVVNDHFGSGDAKTQSTNDEPELQEQPRADDVDEEERDDPSDWKKMKVWYGEDVSKIAKDLESRFPYSFSALHDESGDVPLQGFDTTPPCPLAVFTPFATCLQTKCSVTPTEVAECIATGCVAEFLALPQECWTCFTAVGTNNTEILMSCTDAVPGPYRQVNLPGLLLLSKRQLWDTAYTDLHPGTREVFEIGYLEAKVWTIGQIVCTHTTYYDSEVYYEIELQTIANISSWVEQGRLEMNTLVERFADKQHLFLLGDFNVGPGVEGSGIAPSQPGTTAPCKTTPTNEPSQIYAILTAAFRIDPVQQCTYCSSPDNIYNGNYPARIIDHVFYNGNTPLRKKRVFDDVTLEGGYPLSDHYGVIQYFCRSR